MQSEQKVSVGTNGALSLLPDSPARRTVPEFSTASCQAPLLEADAALEPELMPRHGAFEQHFDETARAPGIVRIQAAWRGHASRFRGVPRSHDQAETQAEDTPGGVDSCCSSIPECPKDIKTLETKEYRLCSKVPVFIDYRACGQIQMPISRRSSRRAEIARKNHYAGIAPVLESLHDETKAQTRRYKECLRSARIIQLWWRRHVSRRCGQSSDPWRPYGSYSYFLGSATPSSRTSINGWHDSPHDFPEISDRFQMPDISSWASRLARFSSSLLQDASSEQEDTFASEPRAFNTRTSAANMPRQIYILFSDTGGGHRASALALQAAFLHLYNDQVSINIVDFIREATPWPASQAPEGYQVVGQFPSVYRKLYESEAVSTSWRDSWTFAMIWKYCREKVIEFLEPLYNKNIDLIISVHPLINHLVMTALLEELKNGHRAHAALPNVVTVVTDLGSAHPSWFEPRVDLLFVPNLELEELAQKHDVPSDKIVQCGLPLREGFWMEDRRPKDELQKLVGLRPVSSEKAEIVLVMGGGEGFGSIVAVAQALGDMLAKRDAPGQLVVVCGRNEEAKSQLEEYSWPPTENNKFLTHILGFVPNMDEYMGAADCLVTKAGPGSIAEAMIKGLPCLLTSFVPGQEEGNKNFVVNNGAGTYISDTNPVAIAEEIASWLDHPSNLRNMSENARKLGRPNATLEIARRIGDGLLNLGVELRETRCKRSVAAASVTDDAEYVMVDLVPDSTRLAHQHGTARGSNEVASGSGHRAEGAAEVGDTGSNGAHPRSGSQTCEPIEDERSFF